MKKNIILILYSLFLYGCEGRECRNEYNKKANEIIFEKLRNFEHLGGTWSCGTIDKHVSISNIYGATDNDIEILLNNLTKASKLKNVKKEINVYKNINHIDKNLKPKGSPVLVLKLDTTKGK